MSSEELKGQMYVSDYRATLLPDGLADGARALDVSSLTLADTEDAGDALDAMNVSRCVV